MANTSLFDRCSRAWGLRTLFLGSATIFRAVVVPVHLSCDSFLRTGVSISKGRQKMSFYVFFEFERPKVVFRKDITSKIQINPYYGAIDGWKFFFLCLALKSQFDPLIAPNVTFLGF